MSKNTKVCVYAICKNESKNVEKWFDCVKSADYIYMVDTGSIDNTVELIQNLMENNPNLNGCSYENEEFSFSDARNFALENAKKNINTMFEDHNYNNWVFVTLDLDEFLMQNGIDMIRSTWMNYYDTMKLHGVSLNEKMEIESNIPVIHKVHSADFHWIRDVHEIIEKNDQTPEKNWRVLYSDIVYSHIQDRTKERNYYDILKRSYNNGDRSSKTFMYLCWELANKNECGSQEILDYISHGIDAVKNNTFDENYNDWQYLVTFYRYAARYHKENKDFETAYQYLEECIRVMNKPDASRLRIVYREIARIAWEIENYKLLSINYYHIFNDIHCLEGIWAEDQFLYTPEEEAVNLVELSNAYYYMENEEEYAGKGYHYLSLMYAELAVQKDPNNSRAVENLTLLKELF